MTDEDDRTPDTPGPNWGVGIALGVAVGAALGVAVNNIALGISFGIAIGVAFALALGGRRPRRDGDGSEPGDDDSER